MWETLRKFGLEYCDLPTMVWNVSVMLRLLTLNIDERNKKPIPISYYCITLVAVCCYLYVYLFSMSWFVFYRCKETGDSLSARIVFSIGASTEVGPIKFLYVLMNRKIIYKTVTEFLSFDKLVIPKSRYSMKLLKRLKVVKKRAIMYWLMLNTNALMYILKSVLLPGRRLMEDNFILYGFEPIYETPNYQIVFIIMSIAICFSIYLSSNICTFLIIITGYIEAQILTLSEELINLWPDAQNFYEFNTNSDQGETRFAANEPIDNKREKIINEYINKHLKEIVKKHSKLITLLKQIETVFRGAMALEFFLLIIALIAQLIGGLENTYIQIPSTLVVVGMDCFTGQIIIDASEHFYNTVYGCKWENFDKNNMKIVMLMLQNSQKTLTLSAGGISVLSFSCFMSFIKNIYSTYTTLRTTMK